MMVVLVVVVGVALQLPPSLPTVIMLLHERRSREEETAWLCDGSCSSNLVLILRGLGERGGVEVPELICSGTEGWIGSM